MMFKSFIMSVLIGFSFLSQAGEFCHGGDLQEGERVLPGDKTGLYCDQETKSVCALLWFQSFINTKNEGQFIIKFNSSEGLDLQRTRVELWMGMNGHGHGSAPLQIEVVSNDTLSVKNAWFVMEGTWDLKIHADVNGQVKEIVVPIYAEKN